MPKKTLKNSSLNKLIQKKYNIYQHRNGRPTTILSWKQTGGGSIMVGQTEFEFTETVDGNTVMLINKKRRGFPECFILEFKVFEGQRYASLISLSSIRTCRPDSTVTTKDLVIELLKYAESHGAKWVELQDETIICDGSEVMSLADYYMLTRGETWYETIAGFLPDKVDEISYTRNTVTTNTWGDIMNKFKLMNRTLYNQFMKDISTIIPNPPSNELAMHVFSRIPVSRRCALYGKYMYYFLVASNISSIKGYKWYIPFAQDIVRPRNSNSEWGIQVTKEE